MSLQKNICLLGATGSIGSSTIDVLRRHPNHFKLVSLAAGKQWVKLLPLVEEFKVEVVCLWDEAAAAELKKRCSAKVLTGMEGLLELVSDDKIHYVVNGLLGAIGCRPTLEAITRNKHVGLANKETMVMAGEIINRTLREHPEARLIPIDSEHSAIFQCLSGRPVEEVEHLELTASGGPFRQWPKSDFPAIRKSDALKHPTWVMGQKITIDSATLMNKGLEVIEAHFLFGLPVDRVRVVIHPTSVVHSFVQFRDGSLMAQLGCPDMRLPIQYALTYPERWPLPVARLDMAQVGKLEFFPPDFDKFPCLDLAYKAGRTGGTAPAVVNAANEEAVALFLDAKIEFVEIPMLIAQVLEAADVLACPNLEDVIAADQWARHQVKALAGPDGAFGVGKVRENFNSTGP